MSGRKMPDQTILVGQVGIAGYVAMEKAAPFGHKYGISGLF